MAPEQARGEPPTAASDIYAIGVVLFEMLTGQRAFTGTLTQIGDVKDQVERLLPTGGEIAEELAAVVGRATARSVEDRLRSAIELRRALSPWATADILAAAPPVRPGSRMLEDRTVIVIAPRTTTDDDPAYVASEVHEQVLHALAPSTLRVLPRVDADASDAQLVVRFTLDTQLAMTLTARGAPPVTLRLPLVIEHIAHSVAVATAAIHAAIGVQAPVLDDEKLAHVHLLRARQISRLGPPATGRAMKALDEARALRPDDPKIQALHAILLARYAFFTSDPDGELLRRAGKEVRAALAQSPDLADAHLAAGHFELHTGDPTIAAGHYRVAIACAPYLAEAHEHLGRVLVEAGYLDAAFARFHEAAALASHYASGQWEIARALALEARWNEFDVAMKRFAVPQRPITKARIAWWRNDRAGLLAARQLEELSFETDMFDAAVDIFLDANRWTEYRDRLLARAFDELSPSRRRRVLVAQLVAEAAGHAGDLETCLRVLDHATTIGLFDLHWLDRVPQLAPVRARPEYAAIHARVEARARGVYDALYGDHGIAAGATMLATS
jgi:serine/threonine-protein kinase